MMMKANQSVVIPSTISNFACIVSSEDSRLSEILTCIARQNALTNFCPTRSELKALLATPTAEENDFGYTFEKPRFSRAYLYAVNLILLVRDAKVRQLEQSGRTTIAAFEAQQEALTNTLTPHRRGEDCLVKSYYACWYKILKPYSVVTLPDVRRFEAGIKDHTIAALYKSDLQTIKRLTRGRR